MSIAVGDEIVDAQRLAEVVSLHEVDTVFLQELHLLGGFDAFGHRQHFQLFASEITASSTGAVTVSRRWC